MAAGLHNDRPGHLIALCEHNVFTLHQGRHLAGGLVRPVGQGTGRISGRAADFSAVAAFAYRLRRNWGMQSKWLSRVISSRSCSRTSDPEIVVRNPPSLFAKLHENAAIMPSFFAACVPPAKPALISPSGYRLRRKGPGNRRGLRLNPRGQRPGPASSVRQDRKNRPFERKYIASVTAWSCLQDSRICRHFSPPRRPGGPAEIPEPPAQSRPIPFRTTRFSAWAACRRCSSE